MTTSGLSLQSVDMTIAEAAESLGLSHHTIRNQVRAGRIAATRRGRDYWITPAAVEAYRAQRLGRPGHPRKDPQPTT